MFAGIFHEDYIFVRFEVSQDGDLLAAGKVNAGDGRSLISTPQAQ
jgi:hypothetical protein